MKTVGSVFVIFIYSGESFTERKLLFCRNALITFTQLHTFTGIDIIDGPGPVKVYAGQVDWQANQSHGGQINWGHWPGNR